MIKCLALSQLKMIPKNVKNHSNCASGITSPPYLPEFQNKDLGSEVSFTDLPPPPCNFYHPLLLTRKGVFYQPSFPIPKIINTPNLSVSTCLSSLEDEKDFLRCLNLPRGYISSSPRCTEDF